MLGEYGLQGCCLCAANPTSWYLLLFILMNADSARSFNKIGHSSLFAAAVVLSAVPQNHVTLMSRF